MEEKYKHKIITIPNILSLFRLLLIPVIMWLYIVRKDPLWTTAVLALSGITDIVDGIVARKCHMVSDFGKAFDPVADKLTQPEHGHTCCCSGSLRKESPQSCPSCLSCIYNISSKQSDGLSKDGRNLPYRHLC